MTQVNDIPDNLLDQVFPNFVLAFAGAGRGAARVVPLQLYQDQFAGQIVAAHRKKIYNVISSEKFIGAYPVMKKIVKLPVSNLKKSIIFLAGIGCTTLEISHILQREKCSVSTMRSTCRQYIVDIFRH